jgi:hypothetical protein
MFGSPCGAATLKTKGLTVKKLEAAPGFEPGIHGFANRCLTNLAMPPRRVSVANTAINVNLPVITPRGKAGRETGII